MSCLSPYHSQVNGNWMPFPCGRCPPCKKRRVDGWVFRLSQQEKISKTAYFVTLTYDEAHLPISPNGHMTLVKDEFPRYMKRLRKLVYDFDPEIQVKYYACGEYGTKNSRPHYHAVIFDVPDDRMLFEAWSLGGVNFGTVHVGTVTSDSIAYVAGYINKQQLAKSRRNDDRVPEFSLMSKGLGSNYVTTAVKNYHKADLSRNYLSKDGGHKIAMPRYYRERIFDEDERSVQQGLAEIASGVSNSERYAEFLAKYGHIEGYEYDKYLEAQKIGVLDSFYSNQKVRSL